MSPEIEKLAEKISDLDPKTQENLLETVAELNYKKVCINSLKNIVTIKKEKNSMEMQQKFWQPCKSCA